MNVSGEWLGDQMVPYARFAALDLIYPFLPLRRSLHLHRACRTQYPPTEAPPAACPIFSDEPQFVADWDRSWATLYMGCARRTAHGSPGESR